MKNEQKARFKLSLAVSIFILILGIILNNGPVFFSGILLFVFFILLYFWCNKIFDQLNLEEDFHQDKIFCGEKVKYQLKLKNEKILPIFWLKVESLVSKNLIFFSSRVVNKILAGRQKFLDTLSIGFYEKIKRTYEIKAQKRGIFRFYETKLEYNGAFGLFTNHKKHEQNKKLIVFPRQVPLKKEEDSFSQLFGTRSQKGWLYPDKLNVIGTRKYQSTDSRKKINWKVTARRGELYSNIYRPSLEREILILHTLYSGLETRKKISENELELSLILVVSLAELFFQKGFKLKFSSSHRQKNWPSSYTRLETKGDEKGREKLLTILARLKRKQELKVDEFFNQEIKKAKQGQKIIIICREKCPQILELLLEFRIKQDLTIIHIGDNYKSIPGIDQLAINREEKWDEVEELKLYS